MNSERRGNRMTAGEIAHAIDVLRGGGVVAIPTDTVYGLAAALEHDTAIERLFEIKGRPDDRAVPVLVGSSREPMRLTTCWSVAAAALADAFWPGALTIVVEASDAVPLAVLRSGRTVGLRMPDDADALAIIRGSGGALAVTSANRSGERECRSADEVREMLGSDVDFVVEAGMAEGGAASTVIDVTVEPPVILREGPIERWRLRDVVSLDMR